jgi:hypothetical protein
MVQGAAFNAMDAVSASPGAIEIVDFAGLCAHGLGEGKANAKYIEILFQNGFQVGTTQVGSSLDVRTNVWDSQCNSTYDVAGSGSVTLISVDSVSVAGRFDVVTALGGHITGSFTAPSCTAPGNVSCK